MTATNNNTALVTYTPKTATGTLSTGDCIRLSGSQTVVSAWSVINNTDSNITQLQVALPTGDLCQTDNTKQYSVVYLFTCDTTAATPVITNPTEFSIANCANTIEIRTADACPDFSIYSLWNEIINNKYVFGSILIVAGIFFCFFGRKFVKVSEILAGVVLVLFLSLFLLFSYLQIQYNTVVFWVIIGVSVALGILAGWFISKLEWLPPAILGGALGYILGYVIYNAFLKYIKTQPLVVFWTTIGCCIIVGVILGICLSRHIMIISTAVLGGYAIIRGASFMLGHFPDEQQVFDLIQQGEWAQVQALLTYYVYIYLLVFVILAGLGIYVQYKFFYETEEEEKKRKEEEKLKELDESTKQVLIIKETK